MDYSEILKIAENKLDSRFNYVIKDLKELISIGSSSGEITSMVGKHLKNLQKTNLPVYLILKDDIDSYILNCKKNGLIIE